jgi:hypothetical protein
VITSEQHIRFADVGSSVNWLVFLGKITRTGDGGVVVHQSNLDQLMTELRKAIGSFAFEVVPCFLPGIGAGSASARLQGVEDLLPFLV